MISKHVEQVVRVLLESGSYRATRYVSEKLVVTACRRIFRGKILRGNVDIVLTIGRPNYAQRQFVKDCKQAGVPFPVRKVQLKAIPKKRASQ